MTFNVRLTVAGIILALAILIGFVLSVPHAREVPETDPARASTTPTVMLKDSYKKGTHTLSGTVTAPDACTSASATAALASTSEAAILLDIAMPPSAGMCLIVPTEVEFSAAVEAPSDAPVSVRVNGAIASTTSHE